MALTWEFWLTLLTKGLLQTGQPRIVKASTAPTWRLKSIMAQVDLTPFFPGWPGSPLPADCRPSTRTSQPASPASSLLFNPLHRQPSIPGSGCNPASALWSRALAFPSPLPVRPSRVPPCDIHEFTCNVPGAGAPLLPCPGDGSAPPSLGYFPGCPVPLFLSVLRL